MNIFHFFKYVFSLKCFALCGLHVVALLYCCVSYIIITKEVLNPSLTWNKKSNTICGIDGLPNLKPLNTMRLWVTLIDSEKLLPGHKTNTSSLMLP